VRPWVKASIGTIALFSAYSMIRAFVIKPKPYIVEFDMNKIVKMHDLNIDDKTG
jgi:hypothetical protein